MTGGTRGERVWLPSLYAIVDPAVLDGAGKDLAGYCGVLRDAGVTLVQYRDKRSPEDVLQGARVVAGCFRGIGDSKDKRTMLILNDRADLAVLAGFDGVHVGQQDIPPDDARRVIGSEPFYGPRTTSVGLVGVSTHNESQVRIANETSADYVAIGPVFATGTKQNPDPVVGLEGVRRARQLTSKPLVAIGGITRRNARSVIEAGADSVAVISGLLPPGESVAQVVRDFLNVLG